MPEKATTSVKRQELVEIASRLFYEQGFGGTGIKQIIEEAGIAKGTFYSHFSSKEDLGVAWLKARHVTWTGWLLDELEDRATPGEKILGLFDFLERWLVEADFRGCAFLNTLAEIPSPDSPLRREVAEHKEGLHAMIQDLALDHFEARGGGKLADLALQKGSALFLLFEGALIETQNLRQTWPIAAARREAQSIIRGSD